MQSPGSCMYSGGGRGRQDIGTIALPRPPACRQMRLWTVLLLAGVASATTLRTAADRKLAGFGRTPRQFLRLELGLPAAVNSIKRGEGVIDAADVKLNPDAYAALMAALAKDGITKVAAAFTREDIDVAGGQGKFTLADFANRPCDNPTGNFAAQKDDIELEPRFNLGS